MVSIAFADGRSSTICETSARTFSSSIGSLFATPWKSSNANSVHPTTGNRRPAEFGRPFLFVLWLAQQIGQLGDVGGDAPRFVLAKQLGRRAATGFAARWRHTR